MPGFPMLRRLVGCALGLFALMWMAGCAGGNLPSSPIHLVWPNDGTSGYGSVGGTLFTLSEKVIDQAYNADVSLEGTPDDPASYGATVSLSTNSLIRGGYRFDNVPPGWYQLTARVSSATNPGMTLEGTVKRVRVTGGNHSQMINAILGEPGHLVTFTGTITQNGVPAAGAVVSVDVAGYNTLDPNFQNDANKVSAIISTTTGGDGKYELVVPDGGVSYYIAAHSDTSMVKESEKITSVTVDVPNVVDITLNAAESPEFAELVLDMLSATLPEPTTRASEQALITRIAVGRAFHAPAEHMTRLERMAGMTGRATRGTAGIVENDLYWSLLSGDVGVRGFHVFRGTAPIGDYVYVGSALDPYQLFFFDNDPVLSPASPVYYTVTSFAASTVNAPHGQMSAPAEPIQAKPLPQITGVSESSSGGMLHAAWQAVPGAKSYVILVYETEPTFNVSPIRDTLIKSSQSSGALSIDLQIGGATRDVWWSVAAYNSQEPNYATSASFGIYRRMTLVNE